MSDIESDEDFEGNETENAAALSQQVESSKVDNDFSEPVIEKVKEEKNGRNQSVSSFYSKSDREEESFL